MTKRDFKLLVSILNTNNEIHIQGTKIQSSRVFCFMTMENVKVLLLFSGKRKCGKDFISERLEKKLGCDACEIIRISEPIKSEWAKKLNLDLNMLLSDGPYKEKYRKEMIVWSEAERSKDYGVFCRKAIETAGKRIVIVSDIRRKTDIQFFTETFTDRVRKIRIDCPQQTRIERGWKFHTGIDDAQSECDLDDYNDWHLNITNDGSLNSDELVREIIDKLNLNRYV